MNASHAVEYAVPDEYVLAAACLSVVVCICCCACAAFLSLL